MSNGMFRYFLKVGETGALTFIDGDLSGNNVLEPPRCYEHTFKHGGKWVSVVCPAMTLPHLGFVCPLCSGGDRPSLVAVFTVIDHRQYVSKKTNKVYVDQRRLLVVKPRSMEMLNQMAIKRGGLRGCRFDVKRTAADGAPNIGDFWDFSAKYDPAQLAQYYTEEYEVNGQKGVRSAFYPANYNEELVFRTPEDMLKMGFGNVAAQQAAASQLKPGGNMPMGAPGGTWGQPVLGGGMAQPMPMAMPAPMVTPGTPPPGLQPLGGPVAMPGAPSFMQPIPGLQPQQSQAMPAASAPPGFAPMAPAPMPGMPANFQPVQAPQPGVLQLAQELPPGQINLPAAPTDQGQWDAVF